MRPVDGTVFDENAEIENARAFLLKECGVSLPRDDAVLLVYLLAQQGIRDAIEKAQSTGLQKPTIPAGEQQVVSADRQALDDLAMKIGQHVGDLHAKIGTIVDLSLATLMVGVEKSIDIHLNRIVEDCSAKFRAETEAKFRARRFWSVMMLTGAVCFGAGVVTVLLVAKAFV